jgi:hypothetical protein
MNVKSTRLRLRGGRVDTRKADANANRHGGSCRPLMAGADVTDTLRRSAMPKRSVSSAAETPMQPFRGKAPDQLTRELFEQ